MNRTTMMMDDQEEERQLHRSKHWLRSGLLRRQHNQGRGGPTYTQTRLARKSRRKQRYSIAFVVFGSIDQ